MSPYEFVSISTYGVVVLREVMLAIFEVKSKTTSVVVDTALVSAFITCVLLSIDVAERLTDAIS